ncbi:unnamed protein product [Timema podura]|uniref:Succinate dehydrogenase [ubiquinone] cytochrome b small subunit n=1 Tax=Timema podura TaxID=61482 RepID=A0ABN7NW49_TIMPD|nr:unnamed protein product [Timema podura]
MSYFLLLRGASIKLLSSKILAANQAGNFIKYSDLLFKTGLSVVDRRVNGRFAFYNKMAKHRSSTLLPGTKSRVVVCRFPQRMRLGLSYHRLTVGFPRRVLRARVCDRRRGLGYGGDNIDPNPPSSEESSHKFWIFERLLSSSLLVICPLAFLVPSVSMDCVLATSLVLHNHWGYEAAVRDYLRPDNVGKFVAGAARGLIYVLSIAGLTGLLYFNTNDKGIVECLQMIWHMETASHPSSAGHT